MTFAKAASWLNSWGLELLLHVYEYGQLCVDEPGLLMVTWYARVRCLLTSLHSPHSRLLTRLGTEPFPIWDGPRLKLLDLARLTRKSSTMGHGSSYFGSARGRLAGSGSAESCTAPQI